MITMNADIFEYSVFSPLSRFIPQQTQNLFRISQYYETGTRLIPELKLQAPNHLKQTPIRYYNLDIMRMHK